MNSPKLTDRQKALARQAFNKLSDKAKRELMLLPANLQYVAKKYLAIGYTFDTKFSDHYIGKYKHSKEAAEDIQKRFDCNFSDYEFFKFHIDEDDTSEPNLLGYYVLAFNSQLLANERKTKKENPRESITIYIS